MEVGIKAEEADIDEMEWLRAAATNPAFHFLKEPEEDIYTIADGRPFHNKQGGDQNARTA